MTDRSAEQWRRIPEHPSYWVSNRGRVRHKNKILKGHNSKYHGHKCLVIDGTVRYSARLVLSAFVGPCPTGMFASFKDGDKTNVDLSNLAWGKRLKLNPGVKVSRQDIADTVALYKSGMTRKEISEHQKITYHAVSYRLRKAGLIP